jgi:hypothetical protein
MICVVSFFNDATPAGTGDAVLTANPVASLLRRDRPNAQQAVGRIVFVRFWFMLIPWGNYGEMNMPDMFRIDRLIALS